MVHDLFSIIPDVIGVEASFSLVRDVIGGRQSQTTGKTFCEKVVARQFAWANNVILARTDLELDTMNTVNNSEMKKEAEERKLHRMAKVHDFLEMWQVVLATVPVLDPAGIIGLLGNGLTPSKIDDFICEPSL